MWDVLDKFIFFQLQLLFSQQKQYLFKYMLWQQDFFYYKNTINLKMQCSANDHFQHFQSILHSNQVGADSCWLLFVRYAIQVLQVNTLLNLEWEEEMDRCPNAISLHCSSDAANTPQITCIV